MSKISPNAKTILKWSGIGLLIRLLIMPSTMHGIDLFFINYFPMQFVTKGIWDPYGFTSTNFTNFYTTYYGPAFFITMSIINFITIKLFNPQSLIKMLELAGTMIATSYDKLSTIDYVNAFSHLDLHKNLILMKWPYLLFDFFIGVILLRLASTEKSKLASYKLWMLNIVVLHSVYAVGSFQLLSAFFIIAALYAGIKNKPYLCVTLLSLGGATILLANVLILPTCLLLADNWKKRFSLLYTAGIVSILLYLPFYLSSGDSVFFQVSHIQYSGSIKAVLSCIFLILYSFILINAMRDSKARNPESALIYYFMITIFLVYNILSVRFRYFISISPLLALIIPQHKKFGIFILCIILMLAFATLTVRETQLGLFAPITQVDFSNLPTIQEIIGRFFNIEIVYKIVYRILVLTFFIAAFWLWRIKSNNKLPVRLKNENCGIN